MITELLDPSDLQRLRHLQVLVRNRVEGFCSGLHRSPHKGHSVEFREHRPYSKGDELRGIDWKLFGKSDRLYIRQYEEETNLHCHLLVDTSGSMGYAGTRSGGLSKLQYAAKLAAGIAYLMLAQQDSVGLVTFRDRVDRYLPPRSLVKQLGRIAETLGQLQPGPPEQSAAGRAADFDLTTLVPKLRRGGLVVLFSDCFGDHETLGRSLSHFVHARNDVLVLQTLDEDEMDFPFRSMAQFRSLEQTGWIRRIDPGRLRKAYLQRFADSQQQLSDRLAERRIELVTTTSSTPIGDTLTRLLRSGGPAS